MEYEWIRCQPTLIELAVVAGSFGATQKQFNDFVTAAISGGGTSSADTFWERVTGYGEGCADERQNYALTFIKKSIKKTTRHGKGMYYNKDSGRAEPLAGAITLIRQRYPEFNFQMEGSKAGWFAVHGDFSTVPSKAQVNGFYHFFGDDKTRIATLEVPIDGKVYND